MANVYSRNGFLKLVASGLSLGYSNIIIYYTWTAKKVCISDTCVIRQSSRHAFFSPRGSEVRGSDTEKTNVSIIRIIIIIVYVDISI